MCGGYPTPGGGETTPKIIVPPTFTRKPVRPGCFGDLWNRPRPCDECPFMRECLDETIGATPPLLLDPKPEPEPVPWTRWQRILDWASRMLDKL